MKGSFFSKTAPLIFYFTAFTIDMWLSFYFGRPASYLLVFALFRQAYSNAFSPILTFWASALCASHAFILGTPAWGVPLCAAILFGLMAYIKDRWIENPLYPALATTCLAAADCYIIRPFYCGSPPNNAYTISVISGTILITMLFSLKLKTGKRGQSLIHT